MVHVGTCENSAEGNTNLQQLSKRARRWCFTLNNYSEEEFGTLNTYFSTKSLYIIGKEVGESKNTPHLQGYAEFKSPMRLDSLKKVNNRMHLENARGNRDENYTYCSKEGNFVSNIPRKNTIVDPLKDKPLYEWQTNVLNMLDQAPNDREIHWFWDADGNMGKTTLAKHLCIKYPKNVLFVGGKGADIKYSVFKFLENEENDLKICIFHFTRSVENYISYEALEAIKDGIFFNSKYESGMCVFNVCHVICLANFEPDKDKLSIDRWNIIDIQGGGDSPVPLSEDN